MTEAYCHHCREVFNPHGFTLDDLIHAECGQTGEYLGHWGDCPPEHDHA